MMHKYHKENSNLILEQNIFGYRPYWMEVCISVCISKPKYCSHNTYIEQHFMYIHTV